VVAERVEDPAETPTVIIVGWPDNGGAGLYGTGESGVGIVHDEDHADGAAGEGFGTEVQVLGRFVGDPEFGAFDGETGDDGIIVVQAEGFDCTESGFVEFDGFRAVANREHWGDGGFPNLGGLRRLVSHGVFLLVVRGGLGHYSLIKWSGEGGDMAAKKRKKKSVKKRKIQSGNEAAKKKKKLTLKRAMKMAAKLIYKHLVELPETRRERNIAAFERAMAKKFKREKGKK
jgi:hypothetical protein